MIELPAAKDQAFVIDAIRNWQEAAASPTLVFTIGDEDYSDTIPTGDWSHDGIGITMQATFARILPLRLHGAPVSLSVSLGGVLIPAMQGLLSLPEPEERTTKILAASPGGVAEKFPLNERVEYAGMRPDYVVRDALRRLPYVPGTVRVQPVDGPVIYAARGRGSDQEPFEPDQTVVDILSKVGERVPYVFRDTAWGGHAAFVSSGLAHVPEVPDYLRFQSEEILVWQSPALTLEQYAEVRVFKDNPDGSSTFPDALANVIYRGHDYPPPAGSTLRIPWSGDAVSAQRHAYDKALELGRGLYQSSPSLPFHPLLERTDMFTVSEAVEEEEGGFFEREWLHYVDTFEQPWGTGFETNPDCTVTLYAEQFVKAPTLAMALVSYTGLIRPAATPFVAPYGVDGDDLYFSDSLDWVTVEGDDLVFDDSGPVTIEGDDLVIHDG